LTCPAVSSCSTDSGQVVMHAVTQCAYVFQHQQSWGSRILEDKPRKQCTMGNCVTD